MGLDWEEREGVAQYVIARARVEFHVAIDPEVLAMLLGVRMVPRAPRGCHGAAWTDPPTICVSKRGTDAQIAFRASHEMGHLGAYWCGVAIHVEAEIDDIAARILMPTRPLRAHLKRWGLNAGKLANRYPLVPAKVATNRAREELALDAVDEF